MALNFPDTPTTGDLYTNAGRTWRWNGTAWDAVRADDVDFDQIYTVSTLPTASTAGAGARAMVSDSLLQTPAFGGTLTGGGTATVPVYTDGTTWFYG